MLHLHDHAEPQNSTHGLPSALSGILVVDLSTSVAGQYAGRLLAMNGADVILVEPPEGSVTRRRGVPAVDRPVGPIGETYLFRHLNQGKRSMTLDMDQAEQAAVLGDLVGRADVVLRDQATEPPPGLTERCIDCVIGQAPSDGPYARWMFTELIHQALGGVMNMTGETGREPIYGIGERGSYAAGTTAYISVVAALYERRASRRGQRVDTTVFESVAAMGQNLVSQASYNRTAESRKRYPGFLAMLRCSDAWVVVFVIRNWPSLCDVFGVPELVSDSRYLTSGDRLARWQEIVGILQERAVTMLADDVVAGCQAGRVSAEKVTSLAELVDSEQWAVRRVLGAVPGPDGSDQLALRRIFDIDGACTEVRTGSPVLAVQNAEVSR